MYEIIPEQTKLNMGCGFKKLSDHWNVDKEPKCNPNQIIDLENTPWPYEDSFFNRITADNILEHLGREPEIFTNILKEMYRVSCNGAEWYICFPHHRCDLYWDDYTHVRPLTFKTFKMFDQKYNNESIANNYCDSTFGIYHDIDIEIKDVKHNLVNYWREQLNNGFIGYQELDIKLNTGSNVCETVELFITVHKPGRFKHLIK